MAPYPLHDAARNGDSGTLLKLLASGMTDVGQKDNLQRQALHMAAWAGHADMVKLLLAHGAKVIATASDDMTAIHFAAQKGHTECVRQLLHAGLHVDAKTRKGITALHMAATNGNVELVTLLLQRKANPLAKNKKEETALQLAKEPEVKALIEAAAAAKLQADASKASAGTARPVKRPREEGSTTSGPQGEAAATADNQKQRSTGPSEVRNTTNTSHSSRVLPSTAPGGSNLHGSSTGPSASSAGQHQSGAQADVLGDEDDDSDCSEDADDAEEDAKYSYTVAAGPQMPPGWKPAAAESVEIAEPEGRVDVGTSAAAAASAVETGQDPPESESDKKLLPASVPAKKVVAKAPLPRLQHLGMDEEDE